MPTMLPLMDKDTVRYITQNITPEEAEYVAGIKATIEDTKCDVSEPKCDDIIYLTKILAYNTKLQTLAITTNPQNYSYKSKIEEFQWIFTRYKEDVFQVIQSIIGVINGAEIAKLELPISDNILELMNEIKQTIQNWIMLHKDNIEYTAIVALSSNFLSEVHKAIYTFRLCKISEPSYNCDCECCKTKSEELPIKAANIIQF